MKTTIIRYRRALLFIPVLLLGLTLNTGCSKSSSSDSGPSGPGANAIWMQNTAFVPSVLNVAVGTTVTWTNKDATTHDVTASDSSFYSGNIAGGGVYSHQFKVAGTYNYKCTIHPGMNGQVIVK